MVRISRRRFLKHAAAATAGVLVTGRMNLIPIPTFATDSLFPSQAGPLTGFSASVIRPDDFLALRLDFYNLTLSQANQSGVGAATLVPIASPAYIIVNLPPQNIAEQAYYEVGLDPNSAHEADGSPIGSNTSVPGHENSSSEEIPDPPGNVQSRLSGWTRLVFKVPTGITSIPYTLTGILQAVSTYDLNLTGTGQQPPGTPGSPTMPSIAPPQTTETAIEAPYRLIVSPNKYARWAHSLTPVAGLDGRIELWHSRLAVRGIDGAPDEVDQVGNSKWYYWNSPSQPADSRTIRAIWAGTVNDPDYYASGGLPTASPTNPYSPSQMGPTHFTSAGVPPNNMSPPNPGTNNNGTPGFRMSLDNRDRDEIVHLTSNFHIQEFCELEPCPTYTPVAVPVNRLMLSSLGAWIDIDARFPYPPPSNALSVLEWRHLATMGRDHYVKVVYSGWLAPFGHRANLVKVTERKFVKVNVGRFAPSYSVVAVMRQRMFIVVREPIKNYPAPGQPWNGRRMPFQTLQITTLVTPPLVDPSNSNTAGTGDDIGSPSRYGQNGFWPQVPGTSGPMDFPFHFMATDKDGNKSQFSASLIFINTGLVDTDYQKILTDPSTRNGYMDTANKSLRRTVQLNGQKIAFTKTDGNSGKSSYETSSITWTGELYPGALSSPPSPPYLPPDETDPGESGIKTQGLPVFYPAVDSSQIRIAAVEELSGTAASSPPSIQYHGDLSYGGPNAGYLWKEFNNNAGEVFAQFQQPVGVDVSRNLNKVGAMINPSLNYVGLSRLAGALPGNPADIAGSVNNMFDGSGFDPTQALLGAALPKILGGINLSDILLKFTGGGSLTALDFGDGKKVPKIVAAVEYNGGVPPTPKDILITLHWEPPIQSWDPILSPSGNPWVNDSRQPLFNVATPPGTPPIVLDGKLVKSFDPAQEPSYNVTGTITGPIELNLLPGGNQNPFFVITIPFNKLQFTAKSGSKPDASADLGGMEFHGILAFIQELQSIIPGAGFDDPPFLDVTATGITAGFNVGVPTIPIGALIISDIKLEASLNIPFIGGAARLRFGISERENPFTITYTIFGGGGFFGMGMGLDGIELMEGSLEFGAFLSLDLGVASGSAHAAVGIYFKYEQDPGPPKKDTTELSGFCSIGGELEVLGLITVSTEFYMSITYMSEDNSCTGQASLTVEVDVALFHQSVTLGPIEKKFSHSPPLDQLAFGYLMPQTGWDDYVAAFYM